MKATKTLLVATAAVACMAATAYAQNPTARSTPGGSNFSGSRPAHSGTHNWSGSRPAHSGNWNGHRGSGRHWSGRHHGARWGFYFGAPILWSSVYWGWPYYGYHPYYYPHTTVIYHDVERYPMSHPEGVLEPAPTTEIGPRSEGAPRQGPLYMNYCESAKAYFPKVTTCPEGWKMISPTQ